MEGKAVEKRGKKRLRRLSKSSTNLIENAYADVLGA